MTLTWNYRRRRSDAQPVKSKVVPIYYKEGCAISTAIGEVVTLTDCLLVTVSGTNLGLTLSISPVCIGQSLQIPKLIYDEVRGFTLTTKTMPTPLRVQNRFSRLMPLESMPHGKDTKGWCQVDSTPFQEVCPTPLKHQDVSLVSCNSSRTHMAKTP